MPGDMATLQMNVLFKMLELVSFFFIFLTTGHVYRGTQHEWGSMRTNLPYHFETENVADILLDICCCSFFSYTVLLYIPVTCKISLFLYAKAELLLLVLVKISHPCP